MAGLNFPVGGRRVGAAGPPCTFIYQAACFKMGQPVSLATQKFLMKAHVATYIAMQLI